MSDGSSIEWCDATWTIAVGCTRVSPGCDRCYAATFVHRGLHESHRGLTKLRPKDAARPGVDWNGTVRTLPERLSDPLRWRKPRRVFVGSITDLFHPSISHEYRAAVFGVMASARQHTFLVLTKRDPRPFFKWLDENAFRGDHADTSNPRGYLIMDAARAALGDDARIGGPGPWPLPNVHIGTSVEDQERADERIPALLHCPAALHWLSIEPQLGTVDLRNVAPSRSEIMLALEGLTWRTSPTGLRVSATHPKIGWVVVGGESGPGARPFDVAWARSLVEQCRAAGVPVFVKQLGAKPISCGGHDRPAAMGDGPPLPCGGASGYCDVKLRDSKGGDMAEWAADLRVREVPT